MAEDRILQMPAAAEALILLFHGVGGGAADLVPLGVALAAQQPGAAVISLAAPDDGDQGRGRQWFSVRGVTEANRPARVQAALPAFRACVQHWQQRSGTQAAQTGLIGFSQGAIMALEATVQDPPLAHSVFALSGRYASLPRQAPRLRRLHFVHGSADAVIPPAHSQAAVAALAGVGVAAGLDLIEGLDHRVDARAIAAVLRAQSPERP
jgi:phospholipase/carboxylesterase